MEAEYQSHWIGRHRKKLLIAGPLVLVGGTTLAYMMGGRYLSTDDAYIQAARVQVSSNIAGQVTAVLVHDNQLVKTGDILFTLDARHFQIAVEEAQAHLAQVRMDIEALKATYAQYQADTQAAKEALAYHEREYRRQAALAEHGITSKSRLDLAENALHQAEGQYLGNSQKMANVLVNLGGKENIALDQHPRLKQAQAILDNAKLQLSYTAIRASIDGTVTKVEQLQVGNYINAAMPQFALVSNTDIWVEANFKEDDLTHMRPNEKATFTIDAYPGMQCTGTVASLSPGTGSTFALLPPQNASGNWVKVVQRLPVRIAIDPHCHQVPLHAGLSVNVVVDTEYHRTLFW